MTINKDNNRKSYSSPLPSGEAGGGSDGASGYINSIKAEDISAEFTDVSILHTSEYNVVAKAQRYGRWYMLKGCNGACDDVALMQQMLRKEFEILIQMQHPGVVQTMGLEHVEGLGLCIVMEYVDGITLKEWMADTTKAATKSAEAIRIADELLQAVAYIHSLGIVHRDLKPQNIMLTRNGLHVKLIDFGLADTDSYAMLKQQAGTVRYMAPEQAVAALPDVRNDIYSLGVVMSEMPLPAYYQRVWTRCLLPIDSRYQNVDEIKADIAGLHKRKTRLLYWAVAAVMAVLLGVVALLSWRVKVMDNELNRVANAKADAIEALHQQMDRTQLTQHTDTLTQWEYRWPDLTQRVMAVNQFCYDYIEQLDERFTADDRDHIREALLSEWQQWQQQIYKLSTADISKERRAKRRKEFGM